MFVFSLCLPLLFIINILLETLNWLSQIYFSSSDPQPATCDSFTQIIAFCWLQTNLGLRWLFFLLMQALANLWFSSCCWHSMKRCELRAIAEYKKRSPVPSVFIRDTTSYWYDFMLTLRNWMKRIHWTLQVCTTKWTVGHRFVPTLSTNLFFIYLPFRYIVSVLSHIPHILFSHTL